MNKDNTKTTKINQNKSRNIKYHKINEFERKTKAEKKYKDKMQCG